MVRTSYYTESEINEKLGRMFKPDYEFLKKCDLWPLDHACLLIMDINPSDKSEVISSIRGDIESFKQKSGHFSPIELNREKPITPEMIEWWIATKRVEKTKILGIAKSAIEAFSAQVVNEPPFKYFDYDRTKRLEESVSVSPPDFLSWAFQKGIAIPEPFRELLPDEENTPLRIPTIDRDHPYYSEELEMAITAWTALYQNGEIKKNKSHKEQLRKWLKVHYPKATQGAIDRVATVINPNKKGGAPPTDQ